MRRRDWLLATCGLAGWAGCASSRSQGDVEVLARRLQRWKGSPGVVFIWAPWSRSAVELEPTMAELEEEYRPFDVQFLAVLLGSMEAPDGFPIPAFVLEGESLEALELFGVSEAPAVLTLARDGRLQHRLEPSASGGAIDPGDIVDAIEAVALQ